MSAMELTLESLRLIHHGVRKRVEEEFRREVAEGRKRSEGIFPDFGSHD
jgi:hypothetical protein